MNSYIGKNTHYGAYPLGMKGIFCRNLKTSLKRHVKGEVKCNTAGETLIVDIYGVNNTVFRYTHENISSEIVQGFATEIYTQIIVKRYKRYIENLFFL